MARLRLVAPDPHTLQSRLRSAVFGWSLGFYWSQTPNKVAYINR